MEHLFQSKPKEPKVLLMFSPFLRPSIIKRDVNSACELFFMIFFQKGLKGF
jgi:hypothetical protein